MKLTAVLFLACRTLVASGIFAGQPGVSDKGFIFPASNAILDSYAFNPSEVLTSFPASFEDYAVIDDITPIYAGEIWITGYTCWGLTTGSTPGSLEMLWVNDGGGFPEGAPLSQETYDAVCLNSGYSYGGYTLWLTQMDLSSSPPSTFPGWIGTHRADGVNWYVACGTEISGSEAYRTVAAGYAWQPLSESLEPGDIFKILETPAWPPALSRSTWAGIKVSFTDVSP